MPERLTVGKLIEILSACDPALPVAVHANNDTSAGDWQRVGILNHYAGEHLVIGNFSHPKYLTKHGGINNPPNWSLRDLIYCPFDEVGRA
jgi:hypothetical protein